MRRRPDRVLHHQALAHGARRAVPPGGRRLSLRVVAPAAPGVRGGARRRRAVGPALARAARRARPQRRRLRVLRRATPRRAGRSCGTPASRRRPAARGRRLRRPRPGGPEQPRGRGGARRAQPAVLRRVRPAHRRRGAGRSGRRRVRVVGGPRHGGARARGPRRPGRQEHHDPQLSRLPRRHLRRRADLPRLRAGLAVRGRVPVLQRGHLARAPTAAPTSSGSPTARRCAPAP